MIPCYSKETCQTLFSVSHVAEISNMIRELKHFNKHRSKLLDQLIQSVLNGEHECAIWEDDDVNRDAEILKEMGYKIDKIVNGRGFASNVVIVSW